MRMPSGPIRMDLGHDVSAHSNNNRNKTPGKGGWPRKVENWVIPYLIWTEGSRIRSKREQSESTKSRVLAVE